LHARRSCSEIIDRVNVANVKAFLWSSIHALQGLAENFRVRLLESDNAGIGYGIETFRDTTLLQDIFNFAICVRNDGDPVAFSYVAQLLQCAGQNPIPVAGRSYATNELVAQFIVLQSDFKKQPGVKHPPEAMIGAPVGGNDLIELILRSAFQIAQMFRIECVSPRGKGSVNDFMIRKQKRIPDIEEDSCDLRIHMTSQ
jgi:hypothetical protein